MRTIAQIFVAFSEKLNFTILFKMKNKVELKLLVKQNWYKLGEKSVVTYKGTAVLPYCRKVQLFCEGHKNLRNRPHGFEVH